jgi:hypothetical protein
MDKSEKIRVMVWSIFAFIFLALGLVGGLRVLSESKLSDSDLQILEEINEQLDQNDDFINLRKVDIKINSEVKKNKIVVNYESESENKIYEFNFDKENKYLDFKCSISDPLAVVMLRNILDAVSVYNGNSKNSAIKIFNSIINLNEYTINEGLNYTEENGYIIAKINTNISLVAMEDNMTDNDDDIILDENNDEYFTVNDLTSQKINIINGNFKQSKNNITMITNNIDNTLYISIYEKNGLTTNSYNSMINILNLILDNNSYISFKNNYKSFEVGNITISGITVENTDIIPNDYENEIINDDGQLVRISFNTSLIAN